jgi:hypothetical protein
MYFCYIPPNIEKEEEKQKRSEWKEVRRKKQGEDIYAHSICLFVYVHIRAKCLVCC